MIMRIGIPLIIISFFFTTTIHAQYTAKTEEAKVVKNCILAVVKVEADADKVKKMEKKNENVGAYKKSVEVLNTYIEELVPKVWYSSSKIEFVTSEQAEKIRASKDKNYCILDFKEYRTSKNWSSSGFDIYLLGERKIDEAPPWSEPEMAKAFTLSWAGDPGNAIARSPFPAANISKGYLMFTLQFLNAQIEASSQGIDSFKSFENYIENKNALIKEKILLVNDPFICKPLGKIVEGDKLEKYYDYPYEIASEAKVEEIILSKDAKYAYLITAPDGGTYGGGTGSYFSHFVVDAKDGSILYFTQQTTPPYNSSYSHVHFNMLSRALK